MEKILTIENNQIGFKSSASFLLKYRSYFGEDGLKDIGKLSKYSEEGDFNAIIIMQRIIWCLAKTYNKKIAPLEDWLDCFEEFDTAEVFSELEPLILKSFGTKKNETTETSEGDEKN